MGDLFGQNGVILEESQVTSSSDGCVSPVDGEVWDRAEAATQEVIRKIQPTVVSEERRKDVIDYVQGLLKGYLSCEVLPFGSVPLKTYLPDGDIDLTAFCGFNFENAFANDVYSVLEAEGRNPAAKFVVKGVQYIHAEVKLVKCFIQNIVVDISFNQIGGLCTLGFLEEIDRLIGKDHLFKRSIILIKAWCYYESRILGAHHGLISSYALETLVLYIFHVFHSSLNGPLAVLHKFLDYFSKFDWENFCVSLSGSVQIASLPDVVVERQETSSRDVLLSDDFIRECVRKFSTPSGVAEITDKTFMQKYLNVVDPLNENNNLGRSVSKGNFFRIKSAFSYGARQLGQILLQPQENIAEEVCKFFINTLNRHGKGQRPDVQELRQVSSCNGFTPKISLPVTEPYRDQIYSHEEDYAYSSDGCFEDTKQVVGSNFWEHGTDSERTIGEPKMGAEKASTETLSAIGSSEEYAIELTTSGIKDLRITEQSDEFFPSIVDNEKLPSGDFPHAPHLYFPHPSENSKMEIAYMNGQTEIGYLDDRLASTASNSRSSSVDTDAHSWQNSNSVYQNSRLASGDFRHAPYPYFPHPLENGKMDNGFLNGKMEIGYLDDRLSSTASNSRSSSVDTDAHSWQNSNSVYQNSCLAGTGRHNTVNVFPDLSGDVDCHLLNLQYGRWWFDNGSAMPIQPRHQFPPIFQPNVSWDVMHQAMPLMNVNGVIPSPAFFPAYPPAAYKPRGIGTYFPDPHSYKDKASSRKRCPGRLRASRINGRAPTPPVKSPHAQGPFRQGIDRPVFSDNHARSPREKVCRNTNGFVQAPEKVRPPKPGSCYAPESNPSSELENIEPVFGVDDSRFSVKSYRLKEEDFPPL